MLRGFRLMFSLMCVLALALTGSESFQESLSDDEIRNIEKFAGDVMGCVNIPGLAMTIVRGDSIFSTGMGVANMATGHPVDKKTIFNLGSAAKAFVPYILAEIMNGKENRDGRVTWGSSLKDILRKNHDFEVPSFWADTTLKDMLVYKSGSSAADLSIMAGLPPTVTRAEVIRRLRLLPRSPEFRNSNHYSNVMYTVAGHLAEEITGMSWVELVKAKVFDKLSMNSSSFAPEGMAVEDSALPYRYHATKPGEQFLELNTSLFNIRPFDPAGSLMSSAEDISLWLRFLIRNLNIKGNDSGINMLIEDAFHLWVTVPGDHREGALVHDSEVALGYGMGWYASTYRGQRRFKYSGGLYAYHTQIWLFPDSYSAIFVSVNGPGMESSRRAVDGILFHISDIILRNPAWVSTNMICSSPDNQHDYHNDSNSDYTWSRQDPNVAEYEGIFGNGLVGNLNIQLNNSGSLVLKIGRNFIGKLFPGPTESKLRFFAFGPLLFTEEWLTGKTFEFIPFGNQGEVIKSRRFEKVRIYMKEQLFYEFQRGVSFENMLVLAEENDRKQQDDARVSQSRRPAGNTNHESDSSESKSNTMLETGSNGKATSPGHQNHQVDGVEGQEDSHDLDDSLGEEAGHSAGEINRSTSKSRNTGCSYSTFPVWVVLVTLISIIVHR